MLKLSSKAGKRYVTGQLKQNGWPAKSNLILPLKFQSPIEMETIGEALSYTEGALVKVVAQAYTALQLTARNLPPNLMIEFISHTYRHPQLFW